MNYDLIDITTLERVHLDSKTFGSCEGCIFYNKENNGCMKSTAKNYKTLEPCSVGEYPQREFYIFRIRDV